VLYNGIDRVDPEIGYIESNCVSCCTVCNLMKKAYSHNFFLTHIKRIAAYERLSHGN
jgi:hypothetical protein